MQYIHHYKSPLGAIILTSDGRALTGLWFEESRSWKPLADSLNSATRTGSLNGAILVDSHKGDRKMPEDAPTEKDLSVFDQTDRWLDIYFSGKEPDFTPPISVRGTAFREMVWRILLTIPYGQTISYGEIASIIAARRSQTGMVSESDQPSMSAQNAKTRMSAQAVGGAVGHNPISLIIPCHRVIGADGRLIGYAGGLGRKQALLELEQADV